VAEKITVEQAMEVLRQAEVDRRMKAYEEIIDVPRIYPRLEITLVKDQRDIILRLIPDVNPLECDRLTLKARTFSLPRDNPKA
jgi:hypothetical protein